MIAHGLRRQDISLASLVQVAESITAMTHAHAEAEAEVDMEAELDVELDNELEASTEAEVETEAELDFELDAEADTDADEEADVDAEAQAAADAEAYAAAEIFTAGAMEAEVDAEAEAEAETETETAAVTDANAETEQEQEYETGADADADADAEAEAEAEGEAEGDEMSFLEKPPSESTAPAASGPNGSTKSVETAGNPAAAAPAVDTAAPGADANMRGPNGCLVHNGLECNGQRAGKCVQSICHCIAGWTGIRCQVRVLSSIRLLPLLALSLGWQNVINVKISCLFRSLWT